MRNRKIDIGVIKLIRIMASTTISVSEKFHEWLKSKGKKGESYEDVIKKMLKQEFLQELGQVAGKLKEQVSKSRIIHKDTKKVAYRLDKVSLGTNAKPNQEKNVKSLSKEKKTKVLSETKNDQKPTRQKTSTNKNLKQWRIEKNLELQRLETELELAKLSNDSAKIKELTVLIAKLKQELEQNKDS